MKQHAFYVPQDSLRLPRWNKVHRPHQALAVAHSRLLVVGCAFILVFLIIAGRLIDVGLLQGRCAGNTCRGHAMGMTARANITDRNGEIIATSLQTFSLYANARVVLDAKEAALKLSQTLPELKYEDILRRLLSGKGFIWLARHLTPQKQEAIMRLGIPGLSFQQDERRVYPHGELFAHVLGYTNIDNKGLGGIEQKFDELLRAQGGALALSLDTRVQHVLRDELVAGIEKFKAQGGAGVVMNVTTGEVLALVSLPDFDPNQVGKIDSQAEALFNRITLGVYELGSNFKIFTTALYLDRGGDVRNTFDVTPPLRIGRFRITDIHPAYGPMPISTIFTESSNIGMAKMALQFGGTAQKNFFEKLGFFKPLTFQLPELGYPLYPKEWTESTTITASYGYGVAVSPLHLVSAIGGIVNKGIMMPPTLCKVDPTKGLKGKRIVSEQTSQIMRELLYKVVSEGTGKKARVLGYEVGGKTGTANTLAGRTYKKGTNITSFVATFPVSNPQFLVMIFVDRPQGIKETYGFNAGGWNAAPIAGTVISRIAPLLQVAPRHEAPFGENAPQFIPASFRH